MSGFFLSLFLRLKHTPLRKEKGVQRKGEPLQGFPFPLRLISSRAFRRGKLRACR